MFLYISKRLIITVVVVVVINIIAIFFFQHYLRLRHFSIVDECALSGASSVKRENQYFCPFYVL